MTTNANHSPIGTSAGAAPRARTPLVALIGFYVAVPILLSLPQGWGRVGLGMTLGASLRWWAVSWLVYWWLAAGVTGAASATLRPWRAPRWTALLLGSVVSSMSARWWHPWMFEMIRPVVDLDVHRTYLGMARDILDLRYVGLLLQSAVPGMVFWVVANLLFDRFFRLSPLVSHASHGERPLAALQGATSAASPLPASPLPASQRVVQAPRFLSRLVRLRGLEESGVVAVEAEDHYVKVYSRDASELIYYRFSDALSDLACCDGLKVNRSFWVRRSAIRDVRVQGRQRRVVLTNGMEIPVSYSNLGLLRQATAAGVSSGV